MRRHRILLIWLTSCLLLGALAPTMAGAFDFRPGAEGFSVSAREENGSLDQQAGSHPYSLVTEVNLETVESAGEAGVPFADGDLRELRLDLPPGLIENPSAVPQCSPAAFRTPRSSPYESSLSGESCPDSTQIGTATVRSSYGGGTTRTFGLFNLVPPPGAPSEIGFSPFGAPVIFLPEILQEGGAYRLSLVARNVPQQVSITSLRLETWGAPGLASHNHERGDCLNESDPATPWALDCGIGDQTSPQAYLTLPSSCQAPLAFGAAMDSWQQPGTVARRLYSRFVGDQPTNLEGCEKIGFEPAVAAQIANPRASSPSGFDFNLDVSSEGLLRPKRLNRAAVRRAVVTLPEGMTINPSVGAGLLGCSPAQYAAETVTSAVGAGCPNGAKIGDFTVQSPLFGQAVEGSLYLAAPFDNPFGSLLALYLVAKSPERGVLIKVGGKLDADQASGRLVATFDGLPQLPYTNLRIHFREGQRSPLATPSNCGAFRTAIDLTPWSGTGTARHVDYPTPISSGIEGSSCPLGTPAFQPQATGGSINSQAGAFTPFYLHLTRSDVEQEITSYSATLPTGLLGQIGNIPYCSDAAIEAARHRGGFEELADPSCPASTSVGHTTSGYGVGPALNFNDGGLFLAGPFHGSTFSIVAINSATVGPVDLGTVVIRSAIDVDPQTAKVSIDAAGSDPIPHIIDGIPIHLRDIRVYIDRPHFTVNPTSCQPSPIVSVLTGSGVLFDDPADDVTAVATAPYQPFNCASLGFEPRISLRLQGGTRRGKFPSLTTTVLPRPGDANIASATVALPSSEFLEQRHIGAICARVQYAREACPTDSVYGSARAYSPLLAQALAGPVYLRSSGNPLPDLVVDLRGGGLGLRIELVGRIDTFHGGLRGTFESVPDAPVSRFELTLFGGKHGLLVNSENTCTTKKEANARFIGHNNVGVVLHPRVLATCGGGKKKAKSKGGKGK